MKHIALAFAVLLAACSSTTGPQGPDPVVQVTNTTNYAVHVVWYDQSGQVSASIVPALATQCLSFTATRMSDSVRFDAWLSTVDTLGSGFWVESSSSWFYPGSSPLWKGGGEWWTVAAAPRTTPNTFTLTVSDDATKPC